MQESEVDQKEGSREAVLGIFGEETHATWRIGN